MQVARQPISDDQVQVVKQPTSDKEVMITWLLDKFRDRFKGVGCQGCFWVFLFYCILFNAKKKFRITLFVKIYYQLSKQYAK